MKKPRLFLIVMFLLPWLSMPLLGKKAIKRFLPSAIFICLFVALECIFARKHDWWKFSKKFSPIIPGEEPLIWGPFFVGSLWIMKFTYGKYLKYFLLNSTLDSFFTFVVTNLFRKIGYASMLKLNKIPLILIFTFKSQLLYGFQCIVEKIRGTKMQHGLTKF